MLGYGVGLRGLGVGLCPGPGPSPGSCLVLSLSRLDHVLFLLSFSILVSNSKAMTWLMTCLL